MGTVTFETGALAQFEEQLREAHHLMSQLRVTGNSLDSRKRIKAEDLIANVHAIIFKVLEAAKQAEGKKEG